MVKCRACLMVDWIGRKRFDPKKAEKPAGGNGGELGLKVLQMCIVAGKEDVL